MKIDEAIKWLEYRAERCDAMDAHSVKCEYEDVAELIKELKWYRDQDLIPRDDLINALNKVGFSATQLGVIHAVPKAEPPHHIGEVAEMVNGDCETCKHYYRQGELTYGFCGDCIEKGMGNYEAYIPKENEQ